jgi:hypothetical protein
MATIGEKRSAILERLKATSTQSEGRPPLSSLPDQGPIEAFGTGFARQATAPLDVLGLAVEPAYGPKGPGVAGTLGELAGSIAPYLAVEAALAKFIPLLRARNLLTSALRTGTTFGAVDFGRKPQPGDTRARNAVEGAMSGAIFGSFLAPTLGPTGEVISEASVPKAMLGGALSSVVPATVGGHPNAPVNFTGNQVLDSAIFNAALAGAFQKLGQYIPSGETEPKPPTADAAPKGPITDPRRLLRPRTFYQPPSPTETGGPVIDIGPAPTPSAPINPLDQVVEPNKAPFIFAPGADSAELQSARAGLNQALASRPQVVPPSSTLDLAATIKDARRGQAPLPRLRDLNPPEQLALPGGAPDLMPMQPGPASEFVQPGAIAEKLANHGVKLAPAVPVVKVENLDPLSGEHSGEWMAVIKSGQPVNLIRGLSKEELDISAKQQFMQSRFGGPNDRHQVTSRSEPVTYATPDARTAVNFGDYFVVFDGQGLPVHSGYAAKGGYLTKLPDALDESAAVAIHGPIPWDRVKFLGKWTDNGKNFDVIPLTEAYSIPRATGAKTARVSPVDPGQLVQLVRSSDEQAVLDNLAGEIRSGAKVKKGRVIALEPDTADSFRAKFVEGGAIPGFDPDTGAINTAGLSHENLAELITLAEDSGDQELIQSLERTKAGLGGKGKKMGVVRERLVPQTRREIVAGNIADLAADAKPTAEEVMLAAESNTTLDEAADAGGRAIAELETGEPPESLRTAKSKKFVDDLAKVKQGRSGDIYSYGNLIKAMKDLGTPIVGSQGEGFRVAMPDKTIVTLSKDEVIARVTASLPPTDAVPVFQGQDLPPIAQPWKEEQLHLPGVKAVAEPALGYVKPIPEPSADVVIQSAEREAGINKPPTPPVTPPAQNYGGKPSTVELKPTNKNIDAFNKERGIERVAKRLSNKMKAPYVKGEAAAKAIEVDDTPNGVILTDHVSGKVTKVKNMAEAAKVISSNTNNEGPMRSDEELRSIFRRRFAGADSAKYRNNIKKKYALYAEYFPKPGEILRAGETPLNSLDGLINSRVPPTVDLTPVEAGSGGRLTLPPDQVPVPPRGGPPIDPPTEWSKLWWESMSRYWTGMKQWSLNVQGKTKGQIAAYDTVFSPLFDGVTKFQNARDQYLEWLVPSIKATKGKAAGERITRYMEAPDKAAAIRDFGISPKEVQVAQLYRTKLDQAFKDFGYENEVPYVQNYMTWRRENPQYTPAQALDTYWKGRAKPKSYATISELERETNGDWAREMDAHKIVNEYFFRGLRKQHLSAPHAAAVDYVNSLKPAPGYQPVVQHMADFVNYSWGSSEMSRRALDTFFKGALDTLGVKHAHETRDDLITIMQQLNTSALMGWRAPLVIRNGFQIFFAYPMLGEKYFGIGMKEALSKEGQARARAAFGIVGGPPVPGADEMYSMTGMLGKITRSGLAGYAGVDDFTRIVAYLGTRAKVMDAAIAYRGHGNIAKFAEDAELLSMFHPVEAQAITKLAQSGNSVAAADRAGYLMQQNTNFIYGTANNPAAFRGVAGRLFGQFGVWPTSYIQYARYISQFGTTAQRGDKIARFLAMNTAFGAAGTLLGVNTWKWLMFGPLVFTGGPMAQTALDAAKVASNFVQGRKDPEAELAASRLKNTVPTLIVPGAMALKDIEGTLKEAPHGAQAVLTRALLGQAPQGAPPSLLPPGARRQAIAEAIRRRQRPGQ